MSDYIICYDIANPRRLARIHRALKKLATPVQYSVFFFSGSDEQLQRCLAQLQQLMNPHQDDIRAYPLPQRGLRLVLGPSALPEGVLLSSLPAEWQPDSSQR
jgi:CRISPR-associated protein Cas2